LFVM